LQRGERALTAGELNYQIFYYCKHNNIDGEFTQDDFIQIKMFVNNFLGKSPNYQLWNDITGALIRCGFELKRRLDIDADILTDVLLSYNGKIDEYENFKILENGDVE